jgi:phosphohistidine phosphatase SixA
MRQLGLFKTLSIMAMIRHGSYSGGELTKEGKKRMRNAGWLLRNHAIKPEQRITVITSDIVRAKQSAIILAREVKVRKNKIIFLKELRNFGWVEMEPIIEYWQCHTDILIVITHLPAFSYSLASLGKFLECPIENREVNTSDGVLFYPELGYANNLYPH